MQNIATFLILSLVIVFGISITPEIEHDILYLHNNNKPGRELCTQNYHQIATLSLRKNTLEVAFKNPQLNFSFINNDMQFKILEILLLNKFSKDDIIESILNISQFESPLKIYSDIIEDEIKISFHVDESGKKIFSGDKRKITFEILYSDNNTEDGCKMEFQVQWVQKEYTQLHYELFRDIACGLILITLIALISLNYDYFMKKIPTSKFSLLAVLISTTQQQLLYNYFYFSDVVNPHHHEYYFPPLIVQEVAYIVQLIFTFMLVKRHFRCSIPLMILFLIIYMVITYLSSLFSRGLMMNQEQIFMFQFILPFPIQIIHNAFNSNTPGIFKLNYLLVLSIRLLFIFYFYGCPESDTEFEIHQISCAVLLLLFAIFIIFLYYQNKIGPLFFLGERIVVDLAPHGDIVNLAIDDDIEHINYPLLQPNFDDFIKTVLIDNSKDCCPICLSSFLLEPNEDDKQLEQIAIPSLKSVMVTPCQHQFHISCLMSWFNVEKGCPICRKILHPQIN